MERETEETGAQEQDWLAIPPELGDGEPAGTLSKRRARSWALVLEARRVPCRAERCGMGWQLLVPSSQLEAALKELRLFEEENRNWPPPLPPDSPLAENTLAPLSALILLATFHNLTLLDLDLLGHRPVEWLALGEAHAGKILRDQWWRAVTALTLHSGWLHLFSNLAIGGVFIVRLCRHLGSGLAWSLVLGSGILGNLANAALQPYHHSAVGASTAVFGAVGILAALSLVRYRHALWKRWPLPVAAALALLALLGSGGERTDLGAHLLGFAFGIILGLVSGWWVGWHGRPGRGFNALLALANAGAVLSAWWAALVFGG